MFYDIGPWTPNQLGPVNIEEKNDVKFDLSVFSIN